jgi:hypothetical protein
MHRLFDHPLSIEQAQIAVDETKYSYGIKLPRVDFRTMEGDTSASDAAIMARECQPSDESDWNWGEQDSLANIPRKKVPSWVKALSLKDNE